MSGKPDADKAKEKAHDKKRDEKENLKDAVKSLDDEDSENAGRSDE